MSLMKSILAVLVLTAIVSIVPVAHAATPAIQVVIAGSSAQWQSLALGAYTEAGAGALHWTQGGFTLSDARPSTTNLDSATVWVVWNAPASKVWVMAKVDSVVGDRCFFAQPGCLLYTTTSNAAAAGGGKISAALWGNDTNLPSSIQALFTGSGQTVNVAATDIRRHGEYRRRSRRTRLQHQQRRGRVPGERSWRQQLHLRWNAHQERLPRRCEL
jgi:hypothetical protein